MSILGLSKHTSPKRASFALWGTDPDVQLCYQIETTFMDIIQASVQTDQ